MPHGNIGLSILIVALVLAVFGLLWALIRKNMAETREKRAKKKFYEEFDIYPTPVNGPECIEKVRLKVTPLTVTRQGTEAEIALLKERLVKEKEIEREPLRIADAVNEVNCVPEEYRSQKGGVLLPRAPEQPQSPSRRRSQSVAT